MSLLAFMHQQESAPRPWPTSLATTPGGKPFTHHSKARTVPHTDMTVATTGIANFGARWNKFLRDCTA